MRERKSLTTPSYSVCREKDCYRMYALLPLEKDIKIKRKGKELKIASHAVCKEEN